MVKLSQQLVQQEEDNGDRTRTERVKEKQLFAKKKKEYEQEKKTFKTLQTKAEQLQKTEFSNLKNIEEYQEKYQTLSLDVKQFFQTPEQVKEGKVQNIKETKIKIEAELQKARDQEIKLEQKNRELQRSNDTTRDDWNSWEESQKYWEGYRKGLIEGKQQLNQGKDVKFNSLKQFASQKGDYEQQRKRAINENREIAYKQKKNIEDLEEQGYKPFIVEEFDKQVPTKTELLYYNPAKNDFKKITEFKAKPLINVKGLDKIGSSTPQERKIFYGGKEISFKTTMPLYKQLSGDIVTPYGKTGITEQQLIKQSQVQQYAEWKKDQPIVYISPSKQLIFLEKGKDIPMDYGGQQTISDYDQKGMIMTAEEFYLPKDKNKSIFGKGWEVTKNLFGKIPKGNWYYNIMDHNKPFGLGMGGLAPYKTGEKSVDITAKIGSAQEYLGKTGEKWEKWAIGGENIKKFESKIEEDNQKKYQQAFEQKYMKDLIFGEIDFETAQKEFEQSTDAKVLQKTYEEDFKTGFKDLSSSRSLFKKGVGGGGRSLLSLSSFGLGAVKTPKSTAVTGIAVYTGVKALKLIPPAISFGTAGGLGTYGTYKFLSPTSTVDEAGAGLVTAIISGVTLGHGAYKYLRSPVVKTSSVKSLIKPKLTKSIGFEQPKIVKTNLLGKKIYHETTIYPKTISKQVIAGRKTIVIAKGKVLLNKYLGIKLQPIYKGIPTQQLGKNYMVQGLRGSYSLKTPSAYQKATTRLVKYGYTSSEAKATLRFYSPKIIKTEMAGVNVLTYGDKIKPFSLSKTTVITKQPRINIEKGITTRGAKSIKDVYKSQKEIIGSIKDHLVLKETSVKTTGFLTDKGGWYNKLTQAGKTTTTYERGIFAKASDIKKSYVTTGIGKSYLVRQQIKYQDLKEYFGQRQIIPKKYKNIFGKGSSKLIKRGDDLTYYEDDRNLFGEKGIPIGNKKLNEIIKDIQKGHYVKSTPAKKVGVTKTTSIKKVQKMMEKLEKQISPKFSSAEQSKYWGTGQYERTVGGSTPQDLSQQIQQLKSIHIPTQKVQKMTGIIKIKDLSNVGSKLLGLTSLKTLTGLKSDVKFKSDLKLKDNLKEVLKTNVIEIPALKQIGKLRSQLDFDVDIPAIITPIRPIPPKRPPTIIKPDPVIPKSILIPYLKGLRRRKSKKGTKSKYDFAYLPDFTARSLGLQAETLSEKQAQKRLKKLLTGLEIRRGVKIK